jgi:hypothetical protein
LSSLHCCADSTLTAKKVLADRNDGLSGARLMERDVCSGTGYGFTVEEALSFRESINSENSQLE